MIPSIEVMKKIADVLEVSIDYLMYDEKKDRPDTKIHDKKLLAIFEKADQTLDERGRVLVFEFIDALIKKKRFEEIMT